MSDTVMLDSSAESRQPLATAIVLGSELQLMEAVLKQRWLQESLKLLEGVQSFMQWHDCRIRSLAASWTP